MVAGFQDDLDSDDEAELSKASAKPSLSTIPSQDVELSSDDEEDKDKNDDIQNNPVITPDEDLDVATNPVMPNFREPITQRTPVNANQTSGNQIHLESVTKDTDKKESDKRGGSRSMASAKVKDSDDSSEDDDEEEASAVTVFADEDLSDDDTTTSSKPVDSGLATDTTQVIYNSIGKCHIYVYVCITSGTKRWLLQETDEFILHL